MIEIVQAPNESNSKGVKIFLAGGISQCPHWQDEIISRLKNESRLDDFKIIVFNPRCNNVPDEKFQTTWEYNKIKEADIISFWFSVGSLNPITLFEYGSNFKSKRKKIIVGCHPDYLRKNAVKIQTGLEMPNLQVNEDFEDFYNDIVTSLVDKASWYKIKQLFNPITNFFS